MIYCEIKTEGAVVTVTVTGHAGHAEPPHDIVCAGVSALFMALCDTAEEAGVEMDYLDGKDAKRVKLYRTRMVTHNIRMFEMGIRAIAREYPENVKIDAGN